MPYQLSEINEKIRRDPAAFLAECDAHYQEPSTPPWTRSWRG